MQRMKIFSPVLAAGAMVALLAAPSTAFANTSHTPMAAQAQYQRQAMQVLEHEAQQAAAKERGHVVDGKVIKHSFKYTFADGSSLQLQTGNLTVKKSEAKYIHLNSDGTASFSAPTNTTISPSTTVSGGGGYTQGEILETVGWAKIQEDFSGDSCFWTTYGTFEYAYDTGNSFSTIEHSQPAQFAGSAGWTHSGDTPTQGVLNSTTAYVGDSTTATLTINGQTMIQQSLYIELDCDYYGVTAPYGTPSADSTTQSSSTTSTGLYYA